MNFWIQGTRDALLKTLKRVNLLFVNDAEIRQLSGEHNIVKAARAVLSMGPTRVVVKRGEYGALFFERDHIFACPAMPLDEVFDPTGAGDTFAGGFLGYLASRSEIHDRELRRAIIFGSVLASFTVEKFSLDRLREITLNDVHERYQDFRALTHFEDFDK
jgi:sugar/nucleoside kinase (ribokinase family)